MKRNYSLAPAMLLLGTGGGASAQQASKSPVIVAFYPPGPLAEDASAESTESLSDFQLYARRVERPLSKAGIVFREVYATSFRVPSGLKTTTFCPRIDVGYYLVAPGKKPQIEYGVMTDTDFLLVAKRLRYSLR